MSDPAEAWSFWSVAIGGGIVGGIIGALAESFSYYWLEGFRERRRERKELIDLARNWVEQDKPDKFRYAKLKKADLRDAMLNGADFSYADLRKANLGGARLIGAKLPGAKLEGADLKGAYLQEANLEGAKYNQDTTWPEGFDPEARGAVLVE